jgi:hypothetical protein
MIWDEALWLLLVKSLGLEGYFIKFLICCCSNWGREWLLKREKDRETERQKDRKTERQKDRKTERQKDRKTERQKDRKHFKLISTFIKYKTSFSFLASE